jgi:hypothetical protein
MYSPSLRGVCMYRLRNTHRFSSIRPELAMVRPLPLEDSVMNVLIQVAGDQGMTPPWSAWALPSFFAFVKYRKDRVFSRKLSYLLTFPDKDQPRSIYQCNLQVKKSLLYGSSREERDRLKQVQGSVSVTTMQSNSGACKVGQTRFSMQTLRRSSSTKWYDFR